MVTFTRRRSPVHISFEEGVKPIDVRIKEFFSRIALLTTACQSENIKSRKRQPSRQLPQQSAFSEEKSQRHLLLLCRQEKKTIKRLYPNKNTQHRYFTKYRNIARNVDKNTEVPPSSVSIPPQCVKLILDTLKLDKEDLEKRSIQRDTKIHQRSNNLTLFYPTLFIQKCQELLKHKNDPYTLAVAIMGLTGRRPIEILRTGRFGPATGLSLSFSGQAKTKNASELARSYVIPVLGPPQEIISALELVRKLLPLSSRENEQISQSFYHQLLSRIRRFQHFFMQDKRVVLNCRSLRGIYVASAYELFNISNQASFNAFASRVLGHSKLDHNTANSYTYFAVAKKKNSNALEKIYKVSDKNFKNLPLPEKSK